MYQGQKDQDHGWTKSCDRSFVPERHIFAQEGTNVGQNILEEQLLLCQH